MVVINKVDRPDARVDEVRHEIEELFLDLDADVEHLDFPIVYASARNGWASLEQDTPGTDLRPLLDVLVGAGARRRSTEARPPAAGARDQPRRVERTSAASRSAACINGTIRKGQPVAWCRADGTIERAKLGVLYITEAHERVEVDEAGPGEIIAVAGLDEVTIGETLADPDDPRPLPVITVDAPALSMTIGVNTSPLSTASRARSSPPA